MNAVSKNLKNTGSFCRLQKTKRMVLGQEFTYANLKINNEPKMYHGSTFLSVVSRLPAENHIHAVINVKTRHKESTVKAVMITSAPTIPAKG
jgi:hypothetical protein